MMKKVIGTLLCITMIMTAAAGCRGKEKTETEAPATSEETTNMTITDDTDTAVLSNRVYAIITKEAENAYEEKLALGFQEVIEAAEGTCIIKHPESATTEAQIEIINELIDQKVNAIAISGNDYDALQPALSAAMEAGVKVSSLDSNVNASSRMIYVNQAGVKAVSETLVEAVYDIAGGEGQWAILAGDSEDETLNAWTEAMEEVMEGAKYKDLELLEIVNGEDNYNDYVEQTQALLQDYPELKVICAPTTTGIAAAAKVIQDHGVAGSVKITGLGIPSEMANYIGDDDEHSCPYMYLWNPTETGRLSGYISMALADGSITGSVGETFITGDMVEYTIETALDGGTEISLKSLYEFDSSNIGDWSSVF